MSQQSPLTNFYPGINFFEIVVLFSSFSLSSVFFLPIADDAYIIMVEVRVSKINSDDFPLVRELIQPY